MTEPLRGTTIAIHTGPSIRADEVQVVPVTTTTIASWELSSFVIRGVSSRV